VSLSSEFAALDEAFGIGLGEMEWLTINALKSAFAPFDERLALINNTSSRHSAELPLATLDDNQRLERVLIDMYLNIVTGSSAVIQTWLGQGVLAVAQWTEGDPPPTPDDIGVSFLNDLDVLHSSLHTIQASDIFVGWQHAPGHEGTITVDTDVRRRPDTGLQGTVWLTWGLADFGGAGVEVGFDKVFSRVLIWTDE